MIIKLLYKYYLSKSLLEVYFSSLNSKSSIFFLYIKLLKIPHFLAFFFLPYSRLYEVALLLVLLLLLLLFFEESAKKVT